METSKEKEGKSISEQYADMMKGFDKKPFINTEWEMRDGLYVQYSAYKNPIPVQSGTSNMLKAL